MVQLTKEIKKLRFSLLSPDAIRKLSVTRIITADTYDEDGLPIDSGLMDGRLGTIEPGQRCKTCGNRVGECEGHFGHIELARPVIHVGFNKIIRNLLRSTCRSCSRILLPQEEVDEYVEKIRESLKENGKIDTSLVQQVLKKAQKTTVCPHCNEKQIKIKLEKPTSFYEVLESGTVRLTPSDIRDRFERIPDDDVLILGINPEFARPEWMILTVLPVPPVCVRPSITLESGVRSEDDLTHKLVDVIRINQRLRENIEAGAPQLIVEDLWELLQYHITTYFDNEVSGIPPARHRSGRILRTISQRLKGKEGRFRSNLSGKRVDFSARTVISPDPNISINEVGVPESIAKILTIPERVTEWNVEELKELVIKGPDSIDGANYIIRADGRRVDLRFVKDRSAIAETLEPEFIVERHLRDGDIVLFNRQPSLHRMSIMAHQVRVMPYRTFRLNLCVCLSGDTEIFTEEGKIKIGELTSSNGVYSPLSCDWDNTKKPYFSGISQIHVINPKELGLKSYKIITENGRIIKATEEHPFYTDKGVIKAGELKEGYHLAVYPIDLPEVGGCPTVLTEEQITNIMPENTYHKYTLNNLDKIGLLNVTAGSRTQISLAKLTGHLFGDGSLNITNRGGRITFRAAEYQDILELYTVAKTLNLNPTPIKESKLSTSYIKEFNGKYRKIKGKCYLFEVRSKPIAIAFSALGVPVGDKTTQEYTVPEWLMDAPKITKRAFLRAYFGSELSTPRLHSNSKRKFNQPVFKIAKIKELSAKPFIDGIKKLLKEFDVELSSITVSKGNLRKDGKCSLIYSCNLAASDVNLLNLFKRIGYEFAAEKEKLARLASEYIQKKIKVKNELSLKLRKAYELRNKGLSYAAIAKEIGGISWSTIASWIYNNRANAGLPSDFPDFLEWKETATKNLNNGFVWDKIIKIEEVFLPVAYDITTVDDNHNFVAAEFLTKNCPPYNADFDGDEMNLHVPQGEEARAEARTLMMVQEQILSPRYGGPIIGGIQDYISIAYLLTRKSTLLTREQVCQLMIAGGVDQELPEPAIKTPEELWTGKQIFSLLLPKGLNISLKAKVCRRCSVCSKENCPYDAYVFIRDGNLLAGVIDKKAFGAGQTDNVFHRLVKDFGTHTARIFLDSITKLLITFNQFNGFTLGIDEIDIKKEARMRIKEVLDNAKTKVHELIEIYKLGELERLPGRTVEETLEMRIKQELAEARDKAGEIAGDYLGLEKHTVIMTKAGARGNPLNLAQMSACVGQQAVRGERIQRGYRHRTLPHFKEGDLGPEARGFVSSNYRDGLDPIEFFFHAMGGREGLVDTAVRTSTSGYMQRRLINALQDIKVEYDNTVRDADGTIIQITYGEDGIDPAKSDHGKAVNIDIVIEKVLSEEKGGKS